MNPDQAARPRVLIVGAGSMGIAAGYHLALGGAEVTYLVRRHRLTALERAQVLYSYDDNTLKTFDTYRLISDVGLLNPGEFEFIVITLDGAALRAPDGEKLSQAVGRLASGTQTKVILGTIGVNLRHWFLDMSGLAPSQVTNGALGIQCYDPHAATLPWHEPTNPVLLVQADLAYRHPWPFGFLVHDNAREVAEAFAAVYNANPVSHCIVMPAEEAATNTAPVFAQFAAFALSDWMDPALIDPESQIWRLAVDAVREIQGLSIHGAAGRVASEQTTGRALLDFWIQWKQDMLPLDLQGFNRYHHGGKVNSQDLRILSECIAIGEFEGVPMTATRELLKRQSALAAAR